MFAAAAIAASLLSPLGDRWRHTRAVAARAAESSHAVARDERELLVSAAWLHDIGYAPTLRDTGFHPIDGARHLERLDADRRLVCLVAHHSGAANEAELRGLSAELAAYQHEASPLSDALAYCDLTTGPAGQSLDVDTRIDEILTRYPPDTIVHRAVTRARPELTAVVRRVQARLGDGVMA